MKKHIKLNQFDSSSKDFKPNKKIKSNILIFYFLDLCYRDKASVFLLLLNFLLAVIFGVVSVSSTSPISILNWYYIVNVLFMLLFSFRLVTYFLNVKLQDQTLTMIIQQKSKRITIIVSMSLAIFLCVFLGQFYSSLAIFLINLGHYSSLKYLLVNFVYQIITCAMLISFLLFLTIAFKQQIVSIIFSFILLSLFISNLPQQIFESKLENTNITLIDSQNNPVSYKASEINNTFEFYDNVQKGRIKYPHLSKYITDYYVGNNLTISNFDSSLNTSVKYKLWDDLGLINQEPTKLLINDQESINLKISSITRNSGLTNLAANDVVSLNITFAKSFKTQSEILLTYEEEQDQEKKAIIKDFIDFRNEWFEMFKVQYGTDLSDGQVLNNIWSDNYTLFGKYTTLELDSTNSYISKNGEKQNISSSMFNSYIFNNYFLPNNSQSSDLVFAKDNVDFEYGSNYNLLINAIVAEMQTEMFARILEDFFLSPTSNYVILTTYDAVVDDSYLSYQKYVNNYQIQNLFLFPANMNSIFTKYAGKDWDAFWFDFGSKSKISFETQDNLFFSEIKSSFFVDDSTNKLSKQLKTPEIKYFIITQVVFFVINTILLVIVFVRRDFK